MGLYSHDVIQHNVCGVNRCAAVVVLQNGIVTIRDIKKEHTTVYMYQTLLDAGDDVGENEYKVSLSSYV